MLAFGSDFTSESVTHLRRPDSVTAAGFDQQIHCMQSLRAQAAADLLLSLMAICRRPPRLQVEEPPRACQGDSQVQ
jgi:hypothetical protein